METILFKETQRFRLPWLMVSFLLPLALCGYITYVQLLQHVAIGNNPAPDIVIVIMDIIVLLLALLFFTFRLKTTVDEKAITVQFLPFRVKKVIRWSWITHAYMREYRAMGEYGGRGIRWAGANNIAYMMSGNTGLQLVFTDKKRVLIGTRRPQELQAVIAQLHQRGIVPSTEKPE